MSGEEKNEAPLGVTAELGQDAQVVKEGKAEKTTTRRRSTTRAKRGKAEVNETVAASLSELAETTQERKEVKTRKRVVSPVNTVDIEEVKTGKETVVVPNQSVAKTVKTRGVVSRQNKTNSGSLFEVATSESKPVAEPTNSVPNLKASASISFSASDDTFTVAPRAEITPAPMTMLLFQEPDVNRAIRARRTRREENNLAENTANEDVAGDAEVETSAHNTSLASVLTETPRKSRRGSRGGRGTDEVKKLADKAVTTAEDAEENEPLVADTANDTQPVLKRVRKRKTLVAAEGENAEAVENMGSEESIETTVRRRRRRNAGEVTDEVEAPKGSTRLEAKRQRRKEGREAGRRRYSITEAEFLARRESVDRQMLVREQNGLNQIAVVEDGVLVEHYVARHTQSSMVGNVYLGRVQNVLPSMEAAFVDIGKGRNAVLYAGEVNWEAAGLEGKPRKIEDALKSGDVVLVQVTKDPIGHKGARLTGQITLAGRHLVLVPNGEMTGISRRLPEKERTRLKRILKEVVPAEHGVIVRTAAEGATEEQLHSDITRLVKAWKDIEAKSKSSKNAPSLLKGEPELAVRVVRDVFNEDFKQLQVEGDNAYETIAEYVQELSPELSERVVKWEEKRDIFATYRVDEQLQKAFDRKVYLPSGGSLVIDRTEAMTVIDVNTGKFTGSGGTLEETVTRNNLEAAEEIVRQLRLRDIGGIIVIDFIDMVLEANRDLVLRRLIECLGRDRTRHQVAEVTSLGLVQMTRKRVGQGLVEAFSTVCECCEGRGYISHEQPVEREFIDSAFKKEAGKAEAEKGIAAAKELEEADKEAKQAEVKAALANIAAAASKHHEEGLAEAIALETEGQASAGANADSGETDFALPENTAAGKVGKGRKERRRSNGGVESAATATTPSQAVATATKKVEKTVKRTRRVSSSGTITPKASAPQADALGDIMTLPLN